jgi:hypothetical protein
MSMSGGDKGRLGFEVECRNDSETVIETSELVTRL